MSQVVSCTFPTKYRGELGCTSKIPGTDDVTAESSHHLVIFLRLSLLGEYAPHHQPKSSLYGVQHTWGGVAESTLHALPTDWRCVMEGVGQVLYWTLPKYISSHLPAGPWWKRRKRRKNRQNPRNRRLASVYPRAIWSRSGGHTKAEADGGMDTCDIATTSQFRAQDSQFSEVR